MTLNGIELEFDMFDYETADKYESALKDLAVSRSAATTLKDAIKDQCNAAFVFFDKLFGEGVSDKIFGGKMNFKECFDAVKAVIDEANRQNEEYKAMLQTYAPNKGKRGK